MVKMAYKVPWEQLAHKVRQEMTEQTELMVFKAHRVYLEYKELLVLKEQ